MRRASERARKKKQKRKKPKEKTHTLFANLEKKTRLEIPEIPHSLAKRRLSLDFHATLFSLVVYQSIHKQLPSKSIEALLDQVPKVRYALTLGDT